ncbi:hypothetical protein BGW36DRAFT_422817 [Talaromyces proteolyticus]|uniref:Uncharacterized protein n=1 Tax=Talaromyces proteolyticus TaxID=1131652 RepID=A0AAD4PZQ3_9EURO|nr:uncharacterized protein BGW36DRAFT_422817 [Talaromyces proteolyticus]KAH8703248.1 hypothetical protein BGW36DRAFT_422817 [Talaromyces proteolyticus]
MNLKKKHAFFNLIWSNHVILFPKRHNEAVDDLWTTGYKIEENVHQQGPTALTSSQAWATYECYNPRYSCNGTIKIYMQIPYKGTESEPWESRAKQASIFPNDVKAELKALIRLNHAGCSSAPRLLNWKMDKQTEAMPVPGGYVVYIVTKQLLGEPLTNLAKLSQWERRSILIAFKDAYMECYECGIVSDEKNKSNVIWNEKMRKWFVYGFMLDNQIIEVC